MLEVVRDCGMRSYGAGVCVLWVPQVNMKAIVKSLGCSVDFVVICCSIQPRG